MAASSSLRTAPIPDLGGRARESEVSFLACSRTHDAVQKLSAANGSIDPYFTPSGFQITHPESRPQTPLRYLLGTWSKGGMGLAAASSKVLTLA